MQKLRVILGFVIVAFGLIIFSCTNNVTPVIDSVDVIQVNNPSTSNNALAKYVILHGDGLTNNGDTTLAFSGTSSSVSTVQSGNAGSLMTSAVPSGANDGVIKLSIGTESATSSSVSLSEATLLVDSASPICTINTITPSVTTGAYDVNVTITDDTAVVLIDPMGAGSNVIHDHLFVTGTYTMAAVSFSNNGVALPSGSSVYLVVSDIAGHSVQSNAAVLP